MAKKKDEDYSKTIKRLNMQYDSIKAEADKYKILLDGKLAEMEDIKKVIAKLKE